MTDYRPTTVSSMYRAAIAEPRHSLRAVSRGSDSGPLSTLGFVLFILINATLFIRPAELLISLEGWPIYEVLIILCMLVSLPSLVAEMSLSSLKRWPISLCVVGLLPVVVLAHLTHFDFFDAHANGFRFFKLVVYYLLLIVHLNSFSRLRKFLFAIMIFTLVMTTLSVMEYHQLIDLPVLSAMHQRQSDEPDEDSGQIIDLARLSSLGIFDNPNDLSRIVVVAMFICMFCMGERRFGPLRFLWAAPILLLGYANALTYSRGGFLALVGGLGILILLRYGWLKTMLLAGLLLPVLLLASTGRQTEISTNTETAHDRILLWRDGLVELRHSPIFGTGMDTYPDITGGLVAHNSFIHAFIELGLVGGTLFVGLFYFSIVPLYRLESFKTQLQNPEFFRMRAYIIAIVVGYAIGLLSSSRCYEVPTYLLIGVASVYARLAAARVPAAIPAFNRSAFWALVRVSSFVLIGHYIFVRLNT